ncbi:MAG: SDR family oxidoreductase [Chloroflexota bacterium]
MKSELTNGKQTVLVTGASSGIGLELAKVFAREGYNLIVVARSSDKLIALAAQLATQYGTQTKVIVKDLSATSAPDELFNEIQASGIQVDVLVNNAGFATYGRFSEVDLQQQLQMMQLNMVTLTHLTRLFLALMIERHSGKILNVASTAGFQPGPLMAVYCATKAYVLSFSESIAEEVRGTGVTVSALCPGGTASGFQERAAMQDSKFIQSGLMKPNQVAEAGYQGLMAAMTINIPGFTNKVLASMHRFLPRRLVARLAMSALESVKH